MEVGSAEIDIIQAKASQVTVGQVTVREIAALDFDTGEHSAGKGGSDTFTLDQGGAEETAAGKSTAGEGGILMVGFVEPCKGKVTVVEGTSPGNQCRHVHAPEATAGKGNMMQLLVSKVCALKFLAFECRIFWKGMLH